MRPVLIFACLFGCSNPPRSAPSVSPSTPTPGALGAPAGAAVRVTTKVAAACGPDWLERHATSIGDLDGNGTLDRVSIVREANGLVVRLHELPSLRETARWTLQPANGYVEVATPRRRGSTRGDLWISVGTEINARWRSTLYHLEGGQLAQVATASSAPTVRIDVDGDGRVDPILPDPVRALLADGTSLPLPVVIPSRIHGASSGHDQQEAVDLDGNGKRELVVERDDGIAIVEVPSWREVWSVRGAPYEPSLIRWGRDLVLSVRLGEVWRIHTTDASHALVVEDRDAPSFGRVITTIGDQLVRFGYPVQLFRRASPSAPVGTLEGVTLRIDDDAAPVGPLRLAAGDAPGLLEARRAKGHLELVLVDPETRVPRRTVWTSEAFDGIEDEVTAGLVDMDRDGANELLVEYITRTFMHHGASWNTSQLELRDGTGQLLWKEPEARIDEWIHEGGDRGRMWQTRRDGTHVRAFDLGDGTTALRIRSARDEYYLLASRSTIIEPIPACLE